MSTDFRTPNGKDAQSRDLPVTLRRDSEHPLLCPLLRFLVLAHRAGAMDQWPFTVPQLLSPVVFAKTASDYVRFRFRGDRAVCWSIRPISIGGAAEFLRESSMCLRFSVPVRAHNLRLSGALKLKWLGKSLWCEK